MTNQKTEWTRQPLILSFPDNPKFNETYGFAGNSGHVNLEGQLMRSPTSTARTSIISAPALPTAGRSDAGIMTTASSF